MHATPFIGGRTMVIIETGLTTFATLGVPTSRCHGLLVDRANSTVYHRLLPVNCWWLPPT